MIHFTLGGTVPQEDAYLRQGTLFKKQPNVQNKTLMFKEEIIYLNIIILMH